MEGTAEGSRVTVLLDTNVLVSGLVFLAGNEHRILKLGEEKNVTLILPEFVLRETRDVLNRRFSGHEILLDGFLQRTDHVIIPWKQIQQDIHLHQGKVRDQKDTAVLTSTILAKPDFVVTGDKTLREDMKRCQEVADATSVCSSSEFLRRIRKRR